MIFAMLCFIGGFGIGACVGLSSERDAWRNRLRAKQERKSVPPQKLPALQAPECVALYRKGCPINKVATTLDISVEEVRRILKHHGIYYI